MSLRYEDLDKSYNLINHKHLSVDFHHKEQIQQNPDMLCLLKIIMLFINSAYHIVYFANLLPFRRLNSFLICKSSCDVNSYDVASSIVSS